MNYYISRKIDATFDQAVDRVKESLEIEGFSVLSELDLQEKMKEKLNVKFKKYKILIVLNTEYAYRAIQHEDKAGTMLPCNIIIQQLRKNEIEVAAVDPIVSMRAIKDPDIVAIAAEIKEKLERIISSLHTGVESFGLV
jgi:uncharacterized protein (DUF302 family)